MQGTGEDRPVLGRGDVRRLPRQDGNGVLDPGEPDGALAFTFKFTGSASGHGRCRHPIKEGSGTGGFELASGQLTFKDRLGACGESITTDTGHISIPPSS
jgi:hypothetical protein